MTFLKETNYSRPLLSLSSEALVLAISCFSTKIIPQCVPMAGFFCENMNVQNSNALGVHV